MKTFSKKLLVLLFTIVVLVNSIGILAFSSSAEGLTAKTDKSFVTTSSTGPAAPTGLTASGITSSTINLSWSAVFGIYDFYVYKDGVIVNTTRLIDKSYTVIGLTPSTTYIFKVKLVDLLGQTAESQPISVTTRAVSTELDSSNVTASSITLNWSAKIGATSYDVYKDGVRVNLNGITGTTYIINELTAQTTYNFTVKGINALGEIVSSNTTIATTATRTGPVAPTGLTASDITSSTINLSWSSEFGIYDFYVYKDGVQVNTTRIIDTSYTVTGLSPSTTYIFTVKLWDLLGQIAESLPLTVTTTKEFTVVNGVLTKYLGPETEVNIPSNLGITKIGNYAFANNSEITSVIIPVGVTTISEGAFQRCGLLTSVTIPNSVVAIGNATFAYCSSLSSLSIPSSVTRIDGDAFYGTPWLNNNPNKFIVINGILIIYKGNESSPIIPNNVTSIGEYAFWDCNFLTDVTIPNGVKSIFDGAFSECGSLTTISIPNSVTSIGNGVFFNCFSLSFINVQALNLNYSSENGILYNKNKTELIFCPNGKNENISIPNTVITIDDEAFYGCGLTGITIPSSVTSIGDWAFYNCGSLTNITIPSSVKSIGDGAFNYCNLLSSIYVEATNLYYSSNNGIFYNKNKTELILCPIGKGGSIIIPYSVIIIKDSAFESCGSITSITIPSSVTTIGNSAFLSCTSLTDIAIPSSVKSIGGNAFIGTPWYDNYPNDLLILNGIVIGYKGTASSVVIPNGITCIASCAFIYCDSITSLTIPTSVTSIGESAFSGTPWFENYPNDLVIVNGILLAYRGTATSLVIPSSITTIGAWAFSWCESLTSITIPNSVKSIGEEAFYNCSALTSINIPNSVTSIGEWAFDYCTSLTSINIPSSITSIENYTFYNCSSLITVTISNNITSIGKEAFYNCESLKYIIIPNSVTSIGKNTFYGCTNFKIYGALGSFASQYASTNTIPFILLGLLAPTGFTSPSKTDTSINLSWNAVTGALWYDVYLGSTKINETPITATSFMVTGLIQNTSYSLTIKAVNEVEVSAASSPLIITTNLNQITSNTYNIDIDKGYISGIDEKTSIALFKSKISNQSQLIKVFYENQTENTENFIGTGMTVRLYEGNDVIQTLTVVIKGDVSGDGIVGLCDLVSIRSELLYGNQLDGAYKSAGDLYGEGEITLNDLVGMMAYISGSGTINQNSYVAFTNKKLTGQTITNVQPGSTVESFLNGVIIEKDSRLEFKKGSTVISGSDKIGTGTVINVYVYGVIFISYTIVIYGDVSGDGKIDLDDLVSVRNDLLDISKLKGAYKTAGDLYNEGSISLNDLVGIMAAVSESGAIRQD